LIRGEQNPTPLDKGKEEVAKLRSPSPLRLRRGEKRGGLRREGIPPGPP